MIPDRAARLRKSMVAALTIAVAATLVPAVFRMVAPARATADSTRGRWHSTGSMNTPRYGFATTVLSGPACGAVSRPAYCGRVLATGGSEGGRSLASAELYDPNTGTWELAGSMHSVHGPGHVAVQLAGGEVLVVGGAPGSEVAELYDPVGGTWKIAAAPPFAVYADAGVLLPDGSVLVLAPEKDGPGTAQRFARGEPGSAGTWSVTTPTDQPHPTPTLTLLAGPSCAGALLNSCGKALAIGGSSAELYDPATQLWQPAGVLPAPISAQAIDCDTRPCHSATLLADGRVLVVGTQWLGPSGELQLPERRGTALYDPRTLAWSSAGVLSEARQGQPAVRMDDGRVVVAGGGTADIFDPIHPTAGDGGWPMTGTPVATRSGHAAVLLGNSRVLMAGGQRDQETTNTAELLEPGATVQAPSVLKLDPPAAPGGPGQGSPTVTLTGAGLDVPGLTVDFGGVAAVVLPSPPPSSTSVTVAAPVRQPGQAAVRVTTTAGSSAVTAESTFSYYGPTISSSPGPEQLAARTGHTATTLADGRVLAVAGTAGGAALATAELYDPASTSPAWVPAGSLAPARDMHTATLIPDGRVLVTGGSEGGKSLDSTRVYAPIPSGSGQWTAADPMAEARHDHTVTLLPGLPPRMLVVGGTSLSETGARSLASAEVFDPASRRWTSSNPAGVSRSGHTATPLADGRVLVAGGDAVSGATAELYDPATGVWSRTGSMLEGRSGHTAVALADGGVLVFGGGATLAAEVYRPETGRWKAAGRLQAARASGHTATALPNGDVVVAGGTATGRVEIYSAASGEWTPTIALTASRIGHTASLLPSGRIMVAGGCGSTCKSVELLQVPVGVPGPTVIAIDPPAGPSATTTRVTVRGVQLSGVTRVRFGDIAVTPVVAPSDQAVVVDAPAQAQGTVPVVLTFAALGEVTGKMASFTYGPGAWRSVGGVGDCGSGSACNGRFLHAAASLPDGRVLVSGGTTNFFDFAPTPLPRSTNPLLRTAKMYDPATREWQAVAAMKSARFGHTATALADGRVLVVGGEDDRGHALASAEIYNPADNQWLAAATTMLSPRFSHTATLLPDGRVLVAGGAVSEEERYAPLAGVELFDPRTGLWTSAGPMAVARQNHTATVLDDHRVLVAGGLTGPDANLSLPATIGSSSPFPPGVAATRSTEVFDARTGGWTNTRPLDVARYAHTATVLDGPRCHLPRPRPECGRVLVAGGGGGGSGGLDSAELYDRAAGTWSAAPQMRTARAGHTANLLADGTVMVAGGGPLFPGDPLPGPLSGAEVYNPASGWRHTSRLVAPRAGHTASLLPDGTVLAAGGYADVARADDGTYTFNLPSPAEVYTPAPDLLSVAPEGGPVGRRTPVALTGTGFAGATAVRFGTGSQALSPEFKATSATAITAISPPRSERGPVEVTVDNAGGTSAHIEPYPTPRFTYVGDIGGVTDLVAEAVSGTEIRLSFTPPDDGQGQPAAAYVVVQQVGDLSPSGFDGATRLCGGGECRPAVNGTLLVTDLTLGTRYSYALRAVGFGGTLGPVSNVASAVAGGRACPVSAATSTGPGQVAYPSGRYSLVGLPGGTRVAADSPLYSWLDQGAGGSYATQPGGDPVAPGQGYWAYFFCPAVVDLAGGGAGATAMALAPYHASMVGNPSASSPARVAGQDFVARWDPALGGAGGYRISGYREADTLAVGEGSWVFSYSGATVSINGS